MLVAHSWWRAHAAESPGHDWDNLAQRRGAWAPRRGTLELGAVAAVGVAVSPPHLRVPWLLALPAAWLYVSYGTSCRRSVWRGRHGGPRDLVVLALLALLLHWRLPSMQRGGALAFFAALHASHMHRLPRWAQPTLSAKRRGCVPTLLVLLAACAASAVRLVRAAPVLLAGYVVLVAVLAVWYRVALHPAGYHVHVHHYQAALAAVPLLRAAAAPDAAVAAAIGLAAEGIARWSAAPLFHRADALELARR